MTPYSRSATSGVMLTAHRLLSTGCTSTKFWVTPNRRGRRSFDLVWAKSTRLPRRAAANARAQATVVRPTPPLPAMTSKRRSNKVGRAWGISLVARYRARPDLSTSGRHGKVHG